MGGGGDAVVEGAILIANAAEVVTMDTDRRVIPNASIAIADGVIVAIGSEEECTKALGANVPTRIDGSKMMAMPGLIDAHAHAGHALVKTFGFGGNDSGTWSKACHAIYSSGTTEAFWEAEAELAALERLKAGVTCGVSLLGGGNSVFRTDDPCYGIAHCRAVERVGIRTVVAVGINRPAPCVPIDAKTPRDVWRYTTITCDGDTETSVEKELTHDTQLEVCEALIQKCHNGANGRIRLAMCCPVDGKTGWTLPEGVTQELVDGLALKTRQIADKYDGVSFTQDGHTKGSVAYAHKLGLLKPDAYLSHSTNLDENDFKALQESGANIVHNPSAVASIQGRCPAPELIDAGVNVAIGSDGTAPDRSSDMFRHMQQCMHYHRRALLDVRVMPPGKVLEMVTTDAARALDAADSIGSLEVGKKADVILINIEAPHIAPLNSMLLEKVICFGNGADVDTTICDGRILMQGRKVLSVDETAVITRATDEAAKAVARCGLGAYGDRRKGFWGASRYTSTSDEPML